MLKPKSRMSDNRVVIEMARISLPNSSGPKARSA